MFDEKVISNNFERPVIGRDTPINNFEAARYTILKTVIDEFTKQKGRTPRVYELGCGTGYGLRFIDEAVEYTGYDYSPAAIEFAKQEFGRPKAEFIALDLEAAFKGEEYKAYFLGADIIIAFEVLEHLENGLDVAEKLRELSDIVLITVPYNEPAGFWGIHHKLHGLTSRDFPGYNVKTYIKEDGQYVGSPPPGPANLLVGFHFRGGDKQEDTTVAKVLAYITTLGRYDSTLPLAIMSIIQQDARPERFILFDDGEHADLRERFIYDQLFKMLDSVGIKWEVVFTQGRGPQFNHNLAQDIAVRDGFDWCWRIDDDEIADSNVLSSLLTIAAGQSDIGAVGGAVLLPQNKAIVCRAAETIVTEEFGVRIQDFFSGRPKPNIQWECMDGEYNVEHLYSSFIYRPGIVRYNEELSQAGNREETLFTYELHKAGYRCIAVPNIVTWHLRSPEGGIRSPGITKEDFDRDEELFRRRVLGGDVDEYVVVLNGGIGDHYVFKRILPALKKRHKNIVIAVSYPDVFAGDNEATIISIEEAGRRYGNLAKYNIYSWMGQRNWKKSIEEAYRSFHGINSN